MSKKIIYSLATIGCILKIMSYFEIWGLQKYSSFFNIALIILLSIRFVQVLREKSKELNKTR